MSRVNEFDGPAGVPDSGNIIPITQQRVAASTNEGRPTTADLAAVVNAMATGQVPAEALQPKPQHVMLPAQHESTQILPPEPKQPLSPQSLQAMQDFISGRSQIPPQIPGVTDHLFAQPQPPAAAPAPVQAPTALAPAPAAGVVPPPPAPTAPAIDPVIQRMLDTQNQTLAFLAQQAQAQARPQAPAIPEEQRARAAGYDWNNLDHRTMFRQQEALASMEQRIGQMQQQQEMQAYQAQQAQTEAYFGNWASQTMQQNYPGLDLPKETVQGIARMAAAYSASGTPEQALSAALASYKPLIEQLHAVKRAPAAPAQAPVQQPLHPGLAALQALPQFAGLTPNQLAQRYQVLQAAALPGAGGGRQDKASLREIGLAAGFRN